MEYFFKQLKRLRDATSLQGGKKAVIRSEIASYMRATKAVRAHEAERHSIGKRSAILSNTKANMKLVRFAVPIALLVLLGGGTSFAASNALPGDALYPVKVKINEKVAASLKFSSAAKADYDAQLAEKRLAEANTLAAQGRLNAEASAKIEKSFTASAQRAQARIQELRASGDEKDAEAISSNFEAALQAHARAFAAIQAQAAGTSRSNGDKVSTSSDSDNNSSSEAIIRLSVPVKAALKSAQNDHMDAQKKTGSETSAQAQVSANVRLSAAASAIADARAKLAKETAKVGAAVSAKASAELDAADTLVVQAKAKADTSAYVDAMVLANKAAQMAQQVSVLLDLQANVSAGADARSNKGKDKSPELNLFDKNSADTDTGIMSRINTHLDNNTAQEVDTHGVQVQGTGVQSNGVNLHL